MSEAAVVASAMSSAPWTILTADCMDVLRDLPDTSVDHVIADPPYDKHTHKNARAEFESKQSLVLFEPLADVDGLVAAQLRVTRRWVLDFCSLEMLGSYRDAAEIREAWIRSGIWRRRDATPQFSGDRPGQACEGIAIMHRPGRKRWNGGGSAAFWETYIERRDRVHATQKDLTGMMRLVSEFTDPGDIVLDTHCGSGTTGVACLRLGRRFVGVERDAAMAETARERLRAEEKGLGILAARAGQQGLFQ